MSRTTRCEPDWALLDGQGDHAQRIGRRIRRGARLFCALIGIVGVALVLGMPGRTQAQVQEPLLSVEQTEDLVRRVYFEGLPEERAKRIGPAGAARLIEMLGDPTEKPHHAQILMALGLCGEAGALEAMRAWASQPREGEVDRATFKAWQALPFALGHLAEHDSRALVDLEQRMNARAPDWRFRHHDSVRLQRQARRAAARSLARTGLPEARRALDRADRSRSGTEADAEFAADLEEARNLFEERAANRGEAR